MTNTVTAYIDENSNLVTENSVGFLGEHNAEMIEISLGPFAEQGFDYYVINYSTGVIGGDNSSEKISSADDRPAYISENKIYFPLESKHTCTGRFSFQVDAYKNSDGKEILKKSSVATLEFKRSLVGGPVAGDGSPLLLKLSELETELAKLKLQCIEDIATSESRLTNSISQLESKHTSDMHVVVDEFAKVEENHSSDIEKLTTKIEEGSQLPVASDTALGGIKIQKNSAFELDENRFIQPVYQNMNPFAVAAIAVTAMVAQSSGEAYVLGSVEEGESLIYSLSEQLMSFDQGYYVFAVLSPGTYRYYDMNYDEIEVAAAACSVHVMKKSGDELTVRQYVGKQLRELVAEGVTFE